MKLLDEIELYTYGYAQLYDSSFMVVSKRLAFTLVGKVASISYDNCYSGKKAYKLAEKLLELNHLSSFEFIRYPNAGIERSYRNVPDFYEKMWGYGLDTKDKKIALIQNHRKTIALFKIKCPIFVARQVMRHRQFSYVEKSLRHCNIDDLEFYDYPLKEDIIVYSMWKSLVNLSTGLYNLMRQRGYKKEIARMVLPVNAFTEFWMCGNLGAYENFFKQRLADDVQPETKDLAKAMLTLLKYKQNEFYRNLGVNL